MSEERQALVPVEERTVEFYGDEIQGVRVTRSPSGESEYFVPLRQLCDYLGISYTGQRERIERNPVLSKKLEPVLITTEGGPQAVQCLSLDYLNGWLFGINVNRVKEVVQERLIRYQEECFLVLRDAFIQREPAGGALSPNQTALVQLRNMALVIADVVDQVLQLDERTAAVESRVDKAARYMGDVNRRLQVVERRLAPGEELTKEQSFEIKERVTQIALEMTRHEPGKSHFAEVYRSLSLETRRSSYKDIPQGAYERAVAFLDEWLLTLREEEE